MKTELSIEAAQKQVDDWIKTYGITYFKPLTNLGILTEEVGELARNMVRTYGEQSSKPTDISNDIAEELADVFWVLLAIANQTNTDLTSAFEANMKKKTSRDKERHLNNPKLK